MEIVQAVVYGIIQGLTEWLPISSTAHLRFIPALLGWQDPGAAFTATIQLGTILAVVLYFWKDLKLAFVAWARSIHDPEVRKTPEAKIGWGAFWGTIPIVLVGLLLKDHIETTFRSLYVVSGALILFGLVMLWADRYMVGKRDLKQIEISDGIVVGLFQCLSLVPGVSRSGSTMVGSFVKGLDRPTAARFSFLLSIPSITGAGIYEMYSNRHEILGQHLVPVLIATVVSFVVGYASIAWFIGYIRKHNLVVFVVYRILIALVILFLVGTGRVSSVEAPLTNQGVDVVNPAP